MGEGGDQGLIHTCRGDSTSEGSNKDWGKYVMGVGVGSLMVCGNFECQWHTNTWS